MPYSGVTKSPPWAQRPALNRATGETIPALAHLRAGEAEDLGDDPELEGAEAVVEEGDDEGGQTCLA